MIDLKELMKLLLLYNYRLKNNYVKSLFFIYKLIKDKKITHLDLLKAYCKTYYRLSNTSFYKGITFLEENDFIYKIGLLGDSRKKIAVLVD